MKSFLTEIKKTKGRLVWGVPLGVLLLDFVWMYWIFSRSKEPELAQGYYQLMMNLPLVNTVTVPVMAAVIASRLCDMENKGNTWKMLCTLQEKSRIYFNKFLLGGMYIFGFSLLQLCMIVFLVKLYHVPQRMQAEQLAYFFCATLITSLVLLLLQEILSLMMENQLYPLFIGIIGTFIGLFSWFFPNLPFRYMIPWGYYCVGCTINNTWNKATRVVHFYTVPFSCAWFAVLLCFAAVLYLYGRNLVLRKEV